MNIALSIAQEVFKLDNREKKRELIENGTYREYIKARTEIYKRTKTDEDDYFTQQMRKSEFFALERQYAEKYGFGTLKCLQQIHEASRKRRQKAEVHVVWWLDNYDMSRYIIVLGTLTFSDEMLHQWSEKYRREKIQQTLKSACVDYIADIDFGERNGREHYHFIGLFDRDTLYKVKGKGKGADKKFYKSVVLDEWQAFYDIKEVIESEKDRRKCISYMSKVTNYALKGGQSKMIVAKGTPFQEEQARKRAEKQAEKERRSHELEGQKMQFRFQTVQEAYAWWDEHPKTDELDEEPEHVNLLSMPFDEFFALINEGNTSLSPCLSPPEREVQGYCEILNDDEGRIQGLL